MCAVDISRCDGNGSLSHHYTNAQQHKCRGVKNPSLARKRPHWNGETTETKVLPTACIYFFIFSKAAPPMRRLSDGQGREAESDFVGGVQGSSAVPMTSVAEVNRVQCRRNGDLPPVGSPQLDTTCMAGSTLSAEAAAAILLFQPEEMHHEAAKID